MPPDSYVRLSGHGVRRLLNMGMTRAWIQHMQDVMWWESGRVGDTPSIPRAGFERPPGLRRRSMHSMGYERLAGTAWAGY